MLKSTDWDLMTDMDLDEAYKFFKSHITDAVKKCSKTMKPHRKKNLYINRRALQMRKRKKSLWDTYSQTSNLLDYARFTKCKNELRSLTRKLR